MVLFLLGLQFDLQTDNCTAWVNIEIEGCIIPLLNYFTLSKWRGRPVTKEKHTEAFHQLLSWLHKLMDYSQLM